MKKRTFRLFVSSTFEDYEREREVLNTEIYKKISTICEEKGFHFEIVDLRWGVSLKASRNQKTVQICLEEVKKAQSGLRPSFLVMLGNRYGWIPLPYKIEEEIWNKLRPEMTLEEYDFLKRWYEKDYNDCQESYVLKKRTGQWVDDANWLWVEDTIRTILQKISVKVLSEEDARQLCFLSATEREIDAAIQLREDFAESTIVCFKNRTDEVIDKDIERCREKIVSKMLGDGENNQLLYLEENADYIESFRNLVFEKLECHILQEIVRLEQKNREDEGTVEIIQSFVKDFYGRKDELNELRRYINNDDNAIQYVVGDSGNGKTALLCKICEENPKHYAHFTSQEGNGFNLLETLSKIVGKIANVYGLGVQKLRYHNAISNFWNVLEKAGEKEEKVLVIIDALDRYTDRNLFRENLFDRMLPNNVKMIISVTTEVSKEVCGYNNRQLYIDKFCYEDAVHLLKKYLRVAGRKLCDEHREIVAEILKNGAQPIQIRILSEICKGVYSFEDLDIHNIEEMELVSTLFENLHTVSGHSRALIKYVLSLLAIAPEGLTENELRIMLMQFPEIQNECFERKEQKREYLPVIYWSRLSYEMGECIQNMNAHGYQVTKLGHHIYQRVIEQLYPEEVEKSRRIMLKYFTDSNNFISENWVNYRKAYSILPLMIQSEESLEGILTDPKTVDWLCKSGQLDYVFNLWMELGQNFKEYAVYKCLLNFYPALNGYPMEFLTFYQLTNPNEKMKPGFIPHGKYPYSYDMTIPFPYSEDAMCKFSEYGSYYVVQQKGDLYVHKPGTYRELNRIRIKEESRVYWYSEINFFITTAVGDGIDFVSYEILDNKVLLLTEFHVASAIKGKKDYEILVSCEDEIIAVVFKNSGLYYQVISEEGMELVVLDLKKDEIQRNWLLFTDTVWWSVHTKKFNIAGKYPVCLSDEMSHIEVQKMERKNGWNIIDIRTLDKGHLIIQKNKNVLQTMILDEENHCRYIYPPNANKVENVLTDGKNIWFVYSKYILLMNLSTGKIVGRYSDEASAGSMLVHSCIVLKKEYSLQYVSMDDFEKIDIPVYISESYVEFVEEKNGIDNNFRSEATLIAFSEDGKYAIAYENEYVIDVFDDPENKIFQITGEYDLTEILFVKDDYMELKEKSLIRVIDMIEKQMEYKKLSEEHPKECNRYYNEDYSEYILVKDNKFLYFGEKQEVFELTNYDLNIIQNQLLNRETELQSKLRERNDKNGFIRRIGDIIILVIPGMQTVMALDLNSKKVSSVYYHPTRIVGAKFCEDYSILIGDSNGHIIKLIYEPLGQLQITTKDKQEKRIPKSFRQKYSAIYKKMAIVIVVFFMIGVVGRFIYNIPKYVNEITGEKLDGKMMAVELIPIERINEEEASAYTDYKVCMDNIQNGILCQQENDFDQDGKKEILVVKSEKDEKKLLLIGTFYRENEGRYEILDEEKIGSFEVEGDYYVFERAGEILSFDFKGTTVFGVCTSEETTSELLLWKLEKDKIISLGQAQVQEWDSGTEIEKLLKEMQLNTYVTVDSGWNLLSDTNDNVKVLATIRQNTVSTEEWGTRVDSDKKEERIEIGMLAFSEGNQERNIQDTEQIDENTFTYTNYNENISFSVTDLFDYSSFEVEKDTYDIVADSSQIEGGGVNMRLSRRWLSKDESIAPEYLHDIKEEDLMPEKTKLQDDEYEYTYNIGNTEKTTAYSWRVGDELFTLNMYFENQHEKRVRQFAEEVKNTLTSYTGEAELGLNKTNYRAMEKTDSIESYYRDFIQDEMASYISINGEEEYQLLELRGTEIPILVVSNGYGFNFFWYNSKKENLYFSDRITPAHELKYLPETDEIVVHVLDSSYYFLYDYYTYYQFENGKLLEKKSLHRYEEWPMDEEGNLSLESEVEYYWLDGAYSLEESFENKILFSKQEYEKEIELLEETTFVPIRIIPFDRRNEQYHDTLHGLKLSAPEQWTCRNSSITGWSAQEYELENIRFRMSIHTNTIAEMGGTAESEIERIGDLWGEPIQNDILQDGFEIVWKDSESVEYTSYYYKRVWPEKNVNLVLYFGYLDEASEEEIELFKSEIKETLNSIEWDE